MCISIRRMRLSSFLPSSLLAYSLLCSSTLCSPTLLAAEINENRLWLPRAQHELKPLLVQAAQLTATTAECAEVISGELDTGRSEANAPVFLVVCRNPAGYTYSVYVTNAGKPNAKVEKVQGEVAAGGGGQTAGAPAEKGEGARIDDKTASKNCIAALKQRTAHMAGIQLDESNLQRLESAAGETQYEIDFDAANPSGMALHFHAVCRVAAGGTALVEIKPRHVEQTQTMSKSPTPVKHDAETDTGARSNATSSKPDEPTSTESHPTEPQSNEPKAAGDDGWEVVQ